MIAAFSRMLSRIALYFAAVGLVLMTLIIGWQVFARYVLNAAPAWTEQAALYLMLWFILFAAAAGVREGFHIRLTLLQDAIGGSAGKGLRALCHGIVGVFGLAMMIGGGQLVAATWSHAIPVLGLPRGSGYIPIAGAGILVCFFALEHLTAELRGGEVEKLWS